jgi:peroxiredoxin
MDSATLQGESGGPVLKPGISARAIVAVALLATFTVLITWRARVLEITLEREREEPALVNKVAPDFSAPTLDGRTVSLADFRGQKRVIVAFWASWCGPCRLEMPQLTKFYEKHHSASSDFEILAVSIDEDPKDAMDFAGRQKLNFPVLLDTRQKIAEAYDVEGIPTMLIIDKDGRVIYGHSGYDNFMEYQLMRELGIEKSTGASDGNASH